MIAAGANLQFPGTTCGVAVTTVDPSLDTRFSPKLGSPARNGGTIATCSAHDLVQGRDLYGEARGTDACAIGAVEADIPRDLIKKMGPENIPRLLFWLLIFLLICLIVGLIVGWRRRKKKGK